MQVNFQLPKHFFFIFFPFFPLLSFTLLNLFLLTIHSFTVNILYEARYIIHAVHTPRPLTQAQMIINSIISLTLYLYIFYPNLFFTALLVSFTTYIRKKNITLITDIWEYNDFCFGPFVLFTASFTCFHS